MAKNILGIDIKKETAIPKFDIGYEQTETKERIPLKKSEKDTKFLVEQKGKCALCGINMIENGIIPPDFHHKDGNPANNKPGNIIAICPNCHRIETRKQWVAKKSKKKNSNQGLSSQLYPNYNSKSLFG